MALTDLIADLKTLVRKVSSLSGTNDQVYNLLTTSDPYARITDSAGNTTIVPSLQSILLAIDAEGSAQILIDASQAVRTRIRKLLLEATLTAPRNYNLLAAASYPPGTAVLFVDVAGGISSTNTATFTAFGSDLINGVGTLVFRSPRSTCMLISDGVSNWGTLPDLNAVLAEMDVTVVFQGVGITVDNTDPRNPVVSLNTATRASLTKADSAVQSVVPGTGIDVDATDPRNPIVGIDSDILDALGGIGSVFQEAVAGVGIDIDNTDLFHPIISSTFDITGYFVNNDTVMMFRGHPVYLDTTGQWRLATCIPPADAVVGLLYDDEIPVGLTARAQTGGMMVQPALEWDEITGTLGGLVPNAFYYLSDTGTITITPPTTVSQSLVRIGMALSSTTMRIDTPMKIRL